MEWEQVRAHYERAFAASGLTQAQVAARGGFRRGKEAQNAISKLLANRNKGPSVATLLGAIEGLGLSPVQFFNQIENDEPATAAAALFVSHRADEDDLAWLRRFTRALRTALDQSARASSTALARPRKRRARRAS